MAKKPSNKTKPPTKKAKPKKAAKSRAKRELNINEIIQQIVDGQNFRQMAKTFNVPLSTLHDFISKPEHSARAREALQTSGDGYADKAEDVLKKAKGNSVEISRARELAQHYRWMASKRNPSRFGDKIDMTTGGKAITFKIGYTKKSDDDGNTGD